MKVSVLIPTYNRLNALTATLTALAAQTFTDFEVVISDQSDEFVANKLTIKTLVRLFELHGNPISILHNLPRKGIAHQRQTLLERASGEFCLYIDDDVLLEPNTLKRMVKALEEEDAGFAGMALIGLSYLDDLRPHHHHIEFWDDKVKPEIIRPKTSEWQRHHLHSAANIYHVGKSLRLTSQNQKKYKVAWVGGCILYNTEKLKEVGGFDFWQALPEEHCGEDVLAQIRLMEKYGGFGIIPSGAYHLELPTTIENREVNAPEYFYNN
jgi:glycosyltransferase involved in cell wall biosynthesis